MVRKDDINTRCAQDGPCLDIVEATRSPSGGGVCGLITERAVIQSTPVRDEEADNGGGTTGIARGLENLDPRRSRHLAA